MVHPSLPLPLPLTLTLTQVSVRPVAMTYEPYFCGFTPDSHPAFSVSPASGKMERRNGDPTTVIVTCDPRGAKGASSRRPCVLHPARGEDVLLLLRHHVPCPLGTRKR